MDRLNTQDMTSTGGARLTIDFAALANNWRTLRDMAPTAECGATIKANGYGLGLENVAEKLWEAGCRTFFVATLKEGLRARNAKPDATIYILNGLTPCQGEVYASNDLRPVIGSLNEAEEWVSGAQASLPCALHVDTGMNRLGLREDEVPAFLERSFDLNIQLLMSHLACGDTPSSLMNGCQLSGILEVAQHFPDVPISLCNSAGVFHGEKFHNQIMRPGIALYGAEALSGKGGLQTVVKAEAPVLSVRTLKKDESVGYAAAFVAEEDRTIATIGAGYADGYIRYAGSTNTKEGACVFINGHRAPLIGRVSMDMIAADVTGIPGIKRGDYAELFGPNIPVDEVAGAAETIGYELLTGLGSRYERIYASID